MQPPPQLFYTNSWKQLLCCSFLLGQCQSRAHQVLAPAPWAVWRITVTFHPRPSCWNSRNEVIAKHRWDVYFLLCSLWGTEMAALNISTYKAEQEKLWLSGMMQKVHKDAGTGPELGGAPWHLLLSSSEAFDQKQKCLTLHSQTTWAVLEELKGRIY